MDCQFEYAQPVKIVFGSGKAQNLQKIVEKEGFHRGVLVADKLFVTNGTVAKIVENTPSIVGVYSDITPNPMLSEVMRATRLLRELDADFVVAMGGGSSLDLAKFAAAMVFENGEAEDYFYRRKDFGENRLPLVALPTTAGTGSEVTGVSVCNDDKTGTKSPLAHKNFFAYMAVVDPMLTLSVPPFVTATTGLDAMAHALEAYWCNAHNPLSDSLAIGALKNIFASIETAYKDGQNVKAREGMSLGSLMAGLAFAPTRTAAVHACSYPLSMDCHLCHGEACTFTLDSFVIVNAKADKVRMDNLASALGFESVEAVAKEIKRLKIAFGLKTTLKDVGIEDATEIAKECVAHPLMKNNPAVLSEKEMKSIFDALKG